MNGALFNQQTGFSALINSYNGYFDNQVVNNITANTVNTQVINGTTPSNPNLTINGTTRFEGDVELMDDLIVNGAFFTETLSVDTITPYLTSTVSFADVIDNTKLLKIDTSNSLTNTSLTLSTNQTADGIFEFPDILGSDTIVMVNQSQTLTNKNLVDDSTFIIDLLDSSKKLKFNVSGNSNRTCTFNVITLSDRSINFPDPNTDETIVYQDYAQTLTNKTLTDITNNITAKSLHSATTIVDVSAATAPTNGQVLTATSGTAATWQTPTPETAISISAPTNATDNNGIILSGTNNHNLQLEFCTSTRPGIISASSQVLPGTKVIALLDSSSISNVSNNSKKILFDLSASSASTNLTLASNQTTSQILNFPNIIATDTLVSNNTTAILSNKELIDGATSFIASGDNTKKLQLSLLNLSSGGTKVYSCPNANGTLVLNDNSQTLSNKELTDSTTSFIDQGDSSKKLQFDCFNITTGNTRTLSVPDSSGIICLDSGALENLTWTGPVSVGPNLFYFKTTGSTSGTRLCTCRIIAFSGTFSVGTFFQTSTAFSSSYRPSADTLFPIIVLNNGVNAEGLALVFNSGFIRITNSPTSVTGAFTAGTIGIPYDITLQWLF